MSCNGNPLSRPAVILDADIGETLDVWGVIQSHVGNISYPNNTYVCSFSRRGYGYSLPAAPTTDPTTRRSSEVTVVELYMALNTAGLLQYGHKVVLVGRGYAAFEVRKFYAYYPSKVAALVFIDGYYAPCMPDLCTPGLVKNDSETASYSYWESTMPNGYDPNGNLNMNFFFLYPRGRCINLLGGLRDNDVTKRRFLSALLTPSHWTNTKAEDILQPDACYESSIDNIGLIPIPVAALVPQIGYQIGTCFMNITDIGGGVAANGVVGSKSNFLFLQTNHYTSICDIVFGLKVANYILNTVYEVRMKAIVFTSFAYQGVMTWHNARTFCESQGMRLPVLHRPENQQAFNSFNFTLGTEWWIGALHASTDIEYKWVGWSGLGATVGIETVASNDYGGITQTLSFLNWDIGYPISDQSSQCVFTSSTFGYLWRNDDCEVERSFICEQPDF
jgi:pimeloyl-ACP methyl ester carboxylesterase